MTHAGGKENLGRIAMIDDAKLRELALKATAGPWEYCLLDADCDTCRRYENGGKRNSIAASDKSLMEEGHDSFIPERLEDLHFIAAANPAEILARLDEKERLLARIAALRECVKWYGDRAFATSHALDTIAADDAAAAKSEVGHEK